MRTPACAFLKISFSSNNPEHAYKDTAISFYHKDSDMVHPSYYLASFLTRINLSIIHKSFNWEINHWFMTTKVEDNPWSMSGNLVWLYFSTLSHPQLVLHFLQWEIFQFVLTPPAVEYANTPIPSIMDFIPAQRGVAVRLNPHPRHGIIKDLIVLNETQP